MKFFNISFAIFIFMFFGYSFSVQAKECSIDQTHLNVFFDELEKKLPYLTKEAETLIKLLNNEKYFSMLKKDMQDCHKNISSRKPPEQSFLLRAYESVGLTPDEELTIHVKGDLRTKRYHYQLSSAELRERLMHGGCHPSGSFDLLDTFRTVTANQLARSSKIVDQIIDVLTPVYTIINEKFNDDFLKKYSIALANGTTGYKKLYSVYNVFYVDDTQSCYEHIQIEEFKQIVIENNIPNSYLETLKNYILFEKLTQKYAPPYNKSYEWYVKFIDDFLVERAAQVSDEDLFSDLDEIEKSEMNDETPTLNDLEENFDFEDLKLPE